MIKGMIGVAIGLVTYMDFYCVPQEQSCGVDRVNSVNPKLSELRLKIMTNYIRSETETGSRFNEHGNTERSRQCTDGSRRDYRRSTVSLITGLERPASHADEDIVQSWLKNQIGQFFIIIDRKLRVVTQLVSALVTGTSTGDVIIQNILGLAVAIDKTLVAHESNFVWKTSRIRWNLNHVGV